MILVSILKHNDIIEEMKVSGHAEYADKGKDLVCAGVSTIMIGSLNALDLLANDTCDLVMDNNLVSIKIKKNTYDSQLIIKTVILQLETLKEKYSDYICIEQTEV